jgi:hypothetical protein
VPIGRTATSARQRAGVAGPAPLPAPVDEAVALSVD